MNKGKALLVIDMQQDFCEGGALAVSGADLIVPILNKYIDVFSKKDLPVFATRDWHPVESKHFKDFGGLWVKHCIQNTPGADFHPQLKLPATAVIISGGVSPEEEGYSAFDSIDTRGISFLKLLEAKYIKELYIGGVATDYCVKFSVLDALKSRLRVKLLLDAIKAVNVKPQDSDSAINEMLKQGAKGISFSELDTN